MRQNHENQISCWGGVIFDVRRFPIRYALDICGPRVASTLCKPLKEIRVILPSVFEARLKLSVCINGLHVPLAHIAESLQRFCRPLVFYNEFEGLDLSLSGSGLLLEHEGRRLFVCSGHQLVNHGRTPDEIIFVAEDGKTSKQTGLSPDGVVRVIPASGSDNQFADAADVLLAEYSTERPGHDLARHFLSLDLANTPDLDKIPNPGVMFAIGYPAEEIDYDPRYDDDGNHLETSIKSKWVKIYLKPAAPTAWDYDGLVPLERYDEEVDYLDEPDGMSGSPVFFVPIGEDHDMRLGLAGILIRGNKTGRHNMLPASRIRDAVFGSAP